MAITIPNNYVYLDWAATAPLCEEAAEAMSPYMVPGLENLQVGGNANALYAPGRAAFSALERARRSIAQSLGAKRADEIIFTSGATEADNAALSGLAQAVVAGSPGSGALKPQIVVSAIEHDAILAPAKRLSTQGFRVSIIRPNRRGFIEPQALEAVLDESTVLVSIQAANSEVGSIQPLEQLAQLSHKVGALFHTDAVQALGKAPLNLQNMDVDAASFSAHKIGGPKGVGVLYVRNKTPFLPAALGGGQEAGRRSGTQNVCGAVGFAAACQAACERQPQETQRLTLLRDNLYESLEAYEQVDATVPDAKGSANYLPNIVHVLVRGLESETLILRLDQLGFGVSGGSACASHSLEPSHVLHAMGFTDDRAHNALRISMGAYTTENAVQAFAKAMGKCLHWKQRPELEM